MTTWQRLEIGSGERRLCLAMNRWGARRALTRFFRAISRLGDGVFWYALMALLAAFGGTRGLHAAIHMAAVGVIAATLYRVLKRWTRRPRPFRSHADITPYVAPLDEFSFPLRPHAARGQLHADRAGLLPAAGAAADRLHRTGGDVARGARHALSERRAGGDADRLRAGRLVAVAGAGQLAGLKPAGAPTTGRVGGPIRTCP